METFLPYHKAKQPKNLSGWENILSEFILYLDIYVFDSIRFLYGYEK